MLMNIASFIFVLGVLVFIHELGHFIVAKRVGIKVERFSLGFPPYIFTKTVGETAYSIGIIPLGGFVKMLGENPDEESAKNAATDTTASVSHREFGAKSIGQRALVIIAGPFMNYLLAIALFVGIFLFGGRPVFDHERLVVGTVTENFPAAQAGLQTNDQIIGIDGYPISDFDSLRVRINKKVAAPLQLTWVRGADTMNATLTTHLEEIPALKGGLDSIGIIGFTQKVQGYSYYSFTESVQRGFVTTHMIVWETVKFVKKAISGEVSAKLIGGPLFIAQQSGKEAEKGATNLFFFMALLSVNLAVLNVLPIPILDGGHLVFLAVERLRGRPLSVRSRTLAQQIGIAFFFVMIIFVTYNDILRMVRGY